MHIGTYVGSQKQPEMQQRCAARSGAHARALIAGGLPGDARSGFRSSGLDVILATAGVTKGALYYQFDNKEALGGRDRRECYARKVGAAVAEREESHRPLIRIVQSTSLKPEDLQRGCPLNNLSQEMSAPRCGIPRADGV